MNISRFFIDRPIFAAVIAVFITLVGIFSYPLLPLSQYPEIAPPTITINTAYPGASAETVAETVAAPIEQEVNGVEGMLYISSSSTSDGTVAVTVTFNPGTDLDAAQVLVQNRVALAEPRLPDQVRQIGVTVNKQESGFLMILGLTSPDKSLDNDYVGNYAQSTLRDRLLRIEGVGAVQIFGGGNYSMRVWIDPNKAAERGLTGPDIVAALRAQNVQAAAGAIGQPPFATNAAAFQLPVQVQGRLTDPEEFSDIVIKTDAEGRVTRVRDVARVELGAQDYGIRGFFDGERGVGMAIIQQPGANALGTADRVLAEVEAFRADLPQGMAVSVPYNPTEFVAASVESVQHTLIEAILLVVLVVVVFLQTWRAAIIPIVAIPVALVATFAVQLALGYSINSLSLFALVLAVGIVVDDAIVVVENVERYIREGLTPREAAYRSMQEVSGALISIGLVLVSVFVPTMFVPGIPGIFYREFAIVITTASVVSLLVSLTLSPAMAAMLLKPHRPHADDARKPGVLGGAFHYLGYAGRKFNDGFDWLADRYGRLTARLVRKLVLVFAVYGLLLVGTGFTLFNTPSGFIPEQDQGFLIGVVQLPPGASLDRTGEVMARAGQIIRDTEGVDGIVAFAGLDGSSFSFGSNAATIFVRLDAFEERKTAEQAAAALAGAITGATGGIEDANIFVIAPPAVQGLGNGNGFQMMVQDRTGAGYRPLEGATFAMMGAAGQTPEQVQQVFSTYNTGSPRIAADVDRDRALMMGVQPSDVFNTLGVYLGSSYVNDFNYLGRTFRVTAQAEPAARDDIADIANLKTRSASGAMVPIGSVATLREDSGPSRIVRYNLFPAAELQGQAAAGVSSGEAIATMEQLAEATLPPGFAYEWTGLALQEKQSSGGATIVFVMAVVFVFLVLAAQYEAFTLPLAVVLIVPMCILAAMVGVNLRGLDNNILVQVGLVVLIALAAKNAILIVEFAKQAEDEGLNRWDAAIRASRTRLRPILMTSFAFIFGVLPLMLATGPGAEMRQSLGTAVVSGMVGVTFFGLVFTPAFYVFMRWVASKLPGRPDREAVNPTTAGLPPHDQIEGAPAPASPRPGDA
ncbi:MAG: efflux RND transporter permease subunit [Alphaproteobacteria bacterium]|jgi:hydrophobe/amphiphile efflux-1 (HAE1) family protein|nr:efflux RND transporter permease subunit [Alphaproteobacteria bacterium]MBU2042827.1 efflux RND transporter permease subunit [Alphaproteobacteria bacterium]MBU2125323.1 efflux RND transporter permease subunit [Alphaproteobacteria bacterium]MBU2208058.1 efflux RND transporter permease subunit [Alphaproteobacteria bacterium]